MAARIEDLGKEKIGEEKLSRIGDDLRLARGVMLSTALVTTHCKRRERGHATRVAPRIGATIHSKSVTISPQDCQVVVREWGEDNSTDECVGIDVLDGDLCGLATALTLHPKEIKSVVFERTKSLRNVTGAAIGIRQNRRLTLDQLGVADILCPIVVPVKRDRSLMLDDGKQKGMPIWMIILLGARVGAGQSALEALQRADSSRAQLEGPNATPTHVDGYRAPEVTHIRKVSQKADWYGTTKMHRKSEVV
ncbi:aromatic-ring hydroxylase-like protein [Tanacetum coccineum]